MMAVEVEQYGQHYRTFVTVGTHEQAFDRLVKAVDLHVAEGALPSPAFVQLGYCTYEPIYCDWGRLLPSSVMAQLMGDAAIVITHGGPSSFMQVIALGKTPIVVPRMAKHGEHVNDHQLEFAHLVESRFGGLVVIDDVDDLPAAAAQIGLGTATCFRSNNQFFCEELGKHIERLFC